MYVIRYKAGGPVLFADRSKVKADARLVKHGAVFITGTGIKIPVADLEVAFDSNFGA